MSSQNKVFAQGFNFKRNENSPEWVVGRLSVNKIQAIKWLESQEGDWVNMNIAQSQAGNYYIELDTWKPTNQSNQPSLNQNQNDKSAPF